MRRLVVLALLAGCGGSSATLPAVDWQWAKFDGFELERDIRSVDATWTDAANVCAEFGASLPTELQFTAAHDAGFDGITRPSTEWFAGDTPRWYNEPQNTYYFDPPSAGMAVAFRCARSR